MKFITILILTLGFAGPASAETYLSRANRIADQFTKPDSELNKICANGTQAQFVRKLTPLVSEMYEISSALDCAGKTDRILSEEDYEICAILTDAFSIMAAQIQGLEEARDSRRAQQKEEELAEATE